MSDERYQHQPWYVRLYRRLRYQPLAYIGFFCRLLKWVATGAKTDPTMTRWQTLRLCWDLLPGEWQVRAKWYYTLEEVFNESREAALWEQREETTND